MELKIAEQDIIYLSYDEPNAEENYADLCSKIPWAKRIHGVKGSDAAHKACAELSETDRFITVDGDNIVDQNFINQVIDLTDQDLEKSVISWCGKNIINGLMYGNGGLKCWPKEYVLNMRTHENADINNPHAQVDFCWDAQYIQVKDCFSTVHNNATAQQAWRAGFREGVKLALDRGERLSKDDFFTKNHYKNLHMLYVWTMVGADVKNGYWAILGAREGLQMTMLTDWDYVQVRDFEYLNDLWAGRDVMPDDVLHSEIFNIGTDLINQLEIPIATQPFNEEQSEFFKTVYTGAQRT